MATGPNEVPGDTRERYEKRVYGDTGDSMVFTGMGTSLPRDHFDTKCKARDCRWYWGPGIGIDYPCCLAFPDGIPEEIAFGDNPHLTSFRGESLTYEPLEPDATVEDAAGLHPPKLG